VFRWLLACAVLCAGACGGSSPSGPTAAGALSLRPPVTVKVMTFNIQHGIGGDNKYSLQRAIDTIARVRPDVVGMQEVTRNHPYYNCEDQPAILEAGLRAATGDPWTVMYQQEWFTLDVSCQNSGRGDGPETEGLALLSRRPMGGASSTPLPGGRLGFGSTLPDVYNLPFVVTHLNSGGAASAGVRSQQIDRLLAWSAVFGEPRLLMGDFNAGSDAAEMQPIVAGYRDAWIEAQKIGRAIGSGASHGSARIDFIFYSPAPTVTIDSAELVDTRPLIGVDASDHKPFVATFVVR
jgi:endonuclease/exonuclease/phosphatase family metal-dependent hydrolase